MGDAPAVDAPPQIPVNEDSPSRNSDIALPLDEAQVSGYFNNFLVILIFWGGNVQSQSSVKMEHSWTPDDVDASEVLITSFLSPAQAKLKSVSAQWICEQVQRCRLLTQLPSDCTNAIRLIQTTVFDDHLVPKPWALDFAFVSNGSSFIYPTSSTGRMEIRLPPNRNVQTVIDTHHHIDRLISFVPKILSECGLEASVVSEYRVTDVNIHVAFQRCQRQPFVSCGDSLSGPYEEILLLFPIKRGYPIALLKQGCPPTHLDGRPECGIPQMYLGDALVLTEVNYCLLSTTIVEDSMFANAFIQIRVSLRSGFIGSQGKVSIPFNLEPERSLLCGTQQPPISICAICMGPIRERRHANLGGVRLDQDMSCSLFHCSVCRSLRPTGPFLLCEFCIHTKVCPFGIPEPSEAVLSNPFLARLWSAYFGKSPVCVHKGFVRNNLVDTLFMLFKPHEFVAGARAFLDFYLNATWHESFAPQVLLQLRAPEKSKQLWAAFYQYFITNAHCPRVRMIVYAVQCALNTGPVLRRYGSNLPTKGREIFLQGDLRSQYNQKGFRVCIFPRVLLAADLAHGLFTPSILRVMAIRIFKYLQTASFNTSVACCCTLVESGPQQLFPILSCRGPVLDLSNEMGQPHLFNPVNRESIGSEQEKSWHQIKKWQVQLRGKISHRNFSFVPEIHFVLPGATNAPTHDNRDLL